MAKREITIWDILFWLGMVILILYILAKIFGIINTPEWVSLIPLITLAFVIGAFYQRMMLSLDKISNRTDHLKDNLDIILNKLNEQDKRIFAIEKQQDTITKLIKTKK